LGGRIAEEIMYGAENVTTGASNDFQQCTQVASSMVTQLGMSEVIGQRYIGSGGGGGPPVSQKLKREIDGEVKRIVDLQYARGMFLLKSNRILLDRVAETLMEQEKINGDQLIMLINEVAMGGNLVNVDTAMNGHSYHREEKDDGADDDDDKNDDPSPPGFGRPKISVPTAAPRPQSIPFGVPHIFAMTDAPKQAGSNSQRGIWV